MLDEVELPAARPVDPASAGFVLPLVNLMNDLDTLVELLRQEVSRGSWLNAYLLAAGANQVIEDQLHQEGISLPRVARHVRRTLPGLLGQVPAAAVGAAHVVRQRTRDLGWQDGRAIRWQRLVAGVVDALAGLTIAPESDPGASSLARSVEALVAGLPELPRAVRRSVIRLPSCFRSFDERPADLARLSEMFIERHPDRTRAIAVVGIRTSGSYTAPLHAAHLRRAGYRDVSVLTLRPGRGWRTWEREAIERARGAGGIVLLTDDPPKSGGSLLSAIRELQERGFPAGAIVPVIPVFDAATLSRQLLEHHPIVLEQRDWAISALLEPDAVGESLAGLLDEWSVISVERTEPAPAATRGHASATYSARLRDRKTGRVAVREVFVKGVGLGYFGEHSLAVIDAVRAFVPEAIGLRDGLLYRQWLPEGTRLGAEAPQGRKRIAEAVAGYAIARSTRLGIEEDLSLRLVDRGAVWQRAGDTVARSFGRWAQFARPVSHPLARALLRVAAPSVVDGSTDIRHWFDGGEGGIRKVDFEERGLSSLDVFCFDHRFDVAGLGEAGLAAEVRAAYAGQSGRPIDAETWLLYRLVHAAERHRDEPAGSLEMERESARVMQGYYAETVFSALKAVSAGPLCAVDLDWTLEGWDLGFPSITPAAALALHALMRHGHRVVLATGRSVSEVRERCEAYGLAGGVAEYGAAIYVHATGRTEALLTGDERALLAAVRVALGRLPDVSVEPLYENAVRAYTFNGAGSRRALSPAMATAAIRGAGLEASVRAIQGARQTDFMVNTIDKGGGLRALAERMGSSDLALGVGDSVEDIPFLKLARVAVTPSHSELAAGKFGVRVLHDSGPASLRAAAAMVLGHQPGRCERCRMMDHVTPRARLLLAMLGAQDARAVGRLAQALRIAGAVRSFEG